MKRMIKLLAAVLATTAIGVVAVDRSRAHDDGRWFGPAALQAATAATAGGYRIEAPPKTVIDLGRNRNGCTPAAAVPVQTVCDIAVAFPDVGLNGTVIFVGTTATGERLTLDPGSW